ncbi:MAG TPA: tetratricopeptide repeat protein [Candidatus Acidoferrales bacterium]|nr:tetratricopeptide repeat protein [Candidatus Acidoferrales bacterium]
MTTAPLLILFLVSVAARLSGVPPSGPQKPGPPAAALPESSARRIESLLIFPFENYSSRAKLDWLSEGLAELSVERLANQGPLVFSRDERLAALERLGLPASTRFSRATMLKIAEEMDADYVVFGAYNSDSHSLTVTARVLRVDPPALTPALEESGTLEGLMELHGRLVWRLLCDLEPGSNQAATCGRGKLRRTEFLEKLTRRRLDALESYVRGLASLERDRDEPKLRLLREAAELEPAWIDPAFALGHAYFVRRDCEAALPWLSRVPPAHERGPEASFEAGICHLLGDDPARAEAAFTALLERLRAGPEPSSASQADAGDLPEVLNNLAVARARLGKMHEAILAFRRVTHLDPAEPDYWFNLGLAELRANDPAGAVAPLREVLARQPENGEARALLIAALERSGHQAEAAVEREALNRSNRPKAASSAATPVALVRLDRIKTHLDLTAWHQFPEVTGTGLRDSSAWPARRRQGRQFHLSRGRQFLAAGKLEDAQLEFNQAIARAPLNSPAAHLGLAEVFRRQGRPDDAIREIRAALGSRDDAVARTELAHLYLEQNRMSEAREELRLALRLNPDYAAARELLAKIEGPFGTGGPQ